MRVECSPPEAAALRAHTDSSTSTGVSVNSSQESSGLLMQTPGETGRIRRWWKGVLGLSMQLAKPGCRGPAGFLGILALCGILSHVHAENPPCRFVHENIAGSPTPVERRLIEPPTADFSGLPTSGYEPLTVDFLDQSSGVIIETWSWEFGDGAGSTEQNPSHTYFRESGPGLMRPECYTVSLTVCNEGGCETIVRPCFVTTYEFRRPTDCSASDSLCECIQVTWRDNADFEDGFLVYRNDVITGFVGEDVTMYEDYSAAPGVAYSYSVLAHTCCGYTGKSEPDIGLRAAPPGPPQVCEVGCLEGVVRVFWRSDETDPCSETGFRLYRDGILKGRVPSGITEFIDSTVLPGVDYEYCVSAYNRCGESAMRCAVGGCGIQTAGLLRNRVEEPGLRLMPNPSDGATTIVYETGMASPTRLTIYDIEGRAVRHLVRAGENRGGGAVIWDGRDDLGSTLPPGTYFCRLDSGRSNSTSKIILTK